MEQADNISRKTILIGTSLRDKPVSHQFAALGRELIKNGYAVKLLVQRDRCQREYADPRIEVLTWPSPRPTRFADVQFFSRLVGATKPACVISNFGATNIMMGIGALRGVPVRIYWHHTLSDQRRMAWKGSRLAYSILTLRARFVYHLATHAVANSEAAKEDLIRGYGVRPSQCKTFWNCLTDPLARGNVQAGAHLNGGSNFVCVGRLAHEKGQDTLIRAVASLAIRLPGVKVTFIGDGQARAEFMKLAAGLHVEQQCRFLGSLPHEIVLENMAAAQATIVPSRAEAFGLVNIESMSVGTPVIGAATGGIAEIVRDGVDGLLFPPGDHEALARCMIELAENSERRRQMAANGRQRFLDHFEMDCAVKTQAQWLCQLIEEKSRIE